MASLGYSSDRATTSRRRFLAASSAFAASIAAPGLACSRTRSDGPNILLIVTDDQPIGTEWAMPSLVEWMGDSGTSFTNGFATTPLCTPSRASILSGRYAHNHGVLINSSPQRLDMDSTVTPYLRSAGYRTGFVGKFLHRWTARQLPHFDEFAIMLGGRYRNSQWNVNGDIEDLDGYTTTIVEEQALDFIRREAEERRPWFLCVAPFAAHRPFVSEPAYRDVDVPEWDGNAATTENNMRDKPPYVQQSRSLVGVAEQVRAGQLRTLRSVDEMIRVIRSELVAQDVLENTLVIFIGDNGYAWADHGLIGKALPYSPSVRVPFYLSWPHGGFGKGRTDDRLVASIDIAPTILEAAGLRQSDTHPMDGRSLLGSDSRDRLLLEWWQGDMAWNHGADTWASTITSRYQYIEYYDLAVRAGELIGDGNLQFREYYDLTRDPYQLTNLLYRATQQDERRLDIAALSKRLKADQLAHG